MATDESRSPRTEADRVLDAAADVRKNHQPNEWDSCVACRAIWPCDAELLAELVLTRPALAEAAAPHSGEGLREALRPIISDAYYEARNEGLTMEIAADRAVDGVLARLRENTNAE